MSDFISREKLKDDIAVLLERNNKLIDEWLANCIDDVIDEQPTVNAKPVKYGRWVKNEEGDFHCSLCKAIVESDEKSRHYWGYCYHCGAKMEVVEMIE